jgi:hypothetical protein
MNIPLSQKLIDELHTEALAMDYDNLAQAIFQDPKATFAEIDAVLVVLIAEYVRSVPALGHADRLAIQTIIRLAFYDPAGARLQASKLTRR